MTEAGRNSTGEFVTLGDALISAIKRGLIPIPELIQDNQQNTGKEGSRNG